MTHRGLGYRLALPAVAVLALAGIGLAVFAERAVQGERSSRRTAVESLGHIVGVLRSGVEEDLSFLVPIDRACVRVRHCL
jgi:hypothetical protein